MSSRLVCSKEPAFSVLSLGIRSPSKGLDWCPQTQKVAGQPVQGAMWPAGGRSTGDPWSPRLAPGWCSVAGELCLLQWEDEEGQRGAGHGSGSTAFSALFPGSLCTTGSGPPLGSLCRALLTLAYSPLPGPPHSSLDPSRLWLLGIDFELWEGEPGAISVTVVLPGLPVTGFGPGEFFLV